MPPMTQRRVAPPLKPSLSSFLGMDLHLLQQPSLLGATLALIGVAIIDTFACAALGGHLGGLTSRRVALVYARDRRPRVANALAKLTGRPAGSQTPVGVMEEGL
jgi:hypothetical protein